MFKSCFYLFAFSLIFLASCNSGHEDDLVITEATENTEEFAGAYFYYDEVEVPENTFEVGSPDIHLGITVRKDEKNPNKEYIVFNAFSSKENYIQWGEKNNFEVALKFEIEEHLYNYANDNGFIEEYDLTGNLNETYVKYEERYMAQILERTDNSGSRAGEFLKKACPYGGGQLLFLYNLLPVMPWGWNNTVSGFTALTSPMTFMSIYDRTFYRNGIGTVFQFGEGTPCFSLQPWLFVYDNRMSSVISL